MWAPQGSRTPNTIWFLTLFCDSFQHFFVLSFLGSCRHRVLLFNSFTHFQRARHPSEQELSPKRLEHLLHLFRWVSFRGGVLPARFCVFVMAISWQPLIGATMRNCDDPLHRFPHHRDTPIGVSHLQPVGTPMSFANLPYLHACNFNDFQHLSTMLIPRIWLCSVPS